MSSFRKYFLFHKFTDVPIRPNTLLIPPALSQNSMDVDIPMQSTVSTSAIGANNSGHGGGEEDAVDAVERTRGEADESDTSSNHLPDTRISTSHSDDSDDNTFDFRAVYDDSDADVEGDDGCMNNLTLGEMQITIANVKRPRRPGWTMPF
jgi:hypothetical protein